MATKTVSYGDDIETPPAPARRVPQIDPYNVVLDFAGGFRRHLCVRLPQNLIADDLKEVQAWSRVQKTQGKALRQHDSLYLISYDQDWVAQAFVSEADDVGATLAGIHIHRTPQRARTLLRDSNYSVVWNGFGYFVERLSDGHKMTSVVATREMVERDLFGLYPTRIT